MKICKNKFKNFYLLALGIWLIAASPAFAQSDKKLIREGNKSYDNKKYSDAEVAYKKSLSKNQKSYEGNFNLGDAYYKQGKYDEAAKQFDLLKSQKADKKTEAAAFHNLGNTLLQSQKYQESVEAYKQALKMNPADEDTRYNLAYAQAMLKQQQQQQQQQENQDKNKDKKDQKQQQQKQEEQKQEQAQQKPQEQKKEISKEDAERILQALNNDEKDKHKKKAKVAATRIRIDKDW